MEQKAWIIDEKTAKQYLTVEDAIDCVEKTWKWYGEGRVIMPNKITTDMSELGVAGWFNSMPAYIGPMDVAGIKVVGGYDGNKALGLPYIKANVLITDSKTGILRALISGDHINDLRTGAQPAVMARLLAAKTDVVTIIGTGLQGYMSLLCMSKVLDMKEIRVCDISEAAMDRFIARFPDAPTERGVKHIHELIRAVQEGLDATLFFVVQIENIHSGAPNDEAHPAFGEALRFAVSQGVNVCAYNCLVTPDSITIHRPVPVIL